ncbi:MAG: septum formation initiator family protein [Pseudomonadota bacterium]
MLLLVLSGLAVAGPWGALAWRENAAALSVRSSQIAALEEEIAALENRVDLLDPKAVDPDLADELARRNLGVLHADEVVITLPEE